jgi:hypothetical protein
MYVCTGEYHHLVIFAIRIQERKLSQYHAISTAIAKKTKIVELGAVIIIVYYIVLSFQYQTPLCTHCVSIFISEDSRSRNTSFLFSNACRYWKVSKSWTTVYCWRYIMWTKLPVKRERYVFKLYVTAMKPEIAVLSGYTTT